MRLDDILKNVNNIDVVKIDVEGAEYLALKGGSELLMKNRPVVFSEFSPQALPIISNFYAEIYLDILLIDENYNLSVICRSGNIIDCKRDKDQVIEFWKQASSDHIDIVAFPIDD